SFAEPLVPSAAMVNALVEAVTRMEVGTGAFGSVGAPRTTTQPVPLSAVFGTVKLTVAWPGAMGVIVALVVVAVIETAGWPPPTSETWLPRDQPSCAPAGAPLTVAVNGASPETNTCMVC